MVDYLFLGLNGSLLTVLGLGNPYWDWSTGGPQERTSHRTSRRPSSTRRLGPNPRRPFLQSGIYKGFGPGGLLSRTPPTCTAEILFLVW